MSGRPTRSRGRGGGRVGFTMSATPSSQRRSSATITDENDFTMSDDASMVDQNHESDAPDDSSVVDSVPPTSSSAPSSSTHSSTPSLVSQSPDSPNIHLSPTFSAFSGDPSDDSVPVARNNTDVTGDAPAVDDVNHPDLSQLHNVVSQSVVPRHTDSENVVGSLDKAEVTLKSPVTSVPQVVDTTTSGSNPVTASPIVTTKTAPPKISIPKKAAFSQAVITKPSGVSKARRKQIQQEESTKSDRLTVDKTNFFALFNLDPDDIIIRFSGELARYVVEFTSQEAAARYEPTTIGYVERFLSYLNSHLLSGFNADVTPYARVKTIGVELYERIRNMLSEANPSHPDMLHISEFNRIPFYLHYEDGEWSVRDFKCCPMLPSDTLPDIATVSTYLSSVYHAFVTVSTGSLANSSREPASLSLDLFTYNGHYKLGWPPATPFSVIEERFAKIVQAYNAEHKVTKPKTLVYATERVTTSSSTTKVGSRACSSSQVSVPSESGHRYPTKKAAFKSKLSARPATPEVEEIEAEQDEDEAPLEALIVRWISHRVIPMIRCGHTGYYNWYLRLFLTFAKYVEEKEIDLATLNDLAQDHVSFQTRYSSMIRPFIEWMRADNRTYGFWVSNPNRQLALAKLVNLLVFPKVHYSKVLDPVAVFPPASFNFLRSEYPEMPRHAYSASLPLSSRYMWVILPTTVQANSETWFQRHYIIITESTSQRVVYAQYDGRPWMSPTLELLKNTYDLALMVVELHRVTREQYTLLNWTDQENLSHLEFAKIQRPQALVTQLRNWLVTALRMGRFDHLPLNDETEQAYEATFDIADGVEGNDSILANTIRAGVSSETLDKFKLEVPELCSEVWKTYLSIMTWIDYFRGCFPDGILESPLEMWLREYLAPFDTMPSQLYRLNVDMDGLISAWAAVTDQLSGNAFVFKHGKLLLEDVFLVQHDRMVVPYLKRSNEAQLTLALLNKWRELQPRFAKSTFVKTLAGSGFNSVTIYQVFHHLIQQVLMGDDVSLVTEEDLKLRLTAGQSNETHMEDESVADSLPEDPLPPPQRRLSKTSTKSNVAAEYKEDEVFPSQRPSASITRRRSSDLPPSAPFSQSSSSSSDSKEDSSESTSFRLSDAALSKAASTTAAMAGASYAPNSGVVDPNIAVRQLMHAVGNRYSKGDIPQAVLDGDFENNPQAAAAVELMTLSSVPRELSAYCLVEQVAEIAPMSASSWVEQISSQSLKNHLSEASKGLNAFNSGGDLNDPLFDANAPFTSTTSGAIPLRLPGSRPTTSIAVLPKDAQIVQAKHEKRIPAAVFFEDSHPSGALLPTISDAVSTVQKKGIDRLRGMLARPLGTLPDEILPEFFQRLPTFFFVCPPGASHAENDAQRHKRVARVLSDLSGKGSMPYIPYFRSGHYMQKYHKPGVLTTPQAAALRWLLAIESHASFKNSSDGVKLEVLRRLLTTEGTVQHKMGGLTADSELFSSDTYFPPVEKNTTARKCILLLSGYAKLRAVFLLHFCWSTRNNNTFDANSTVLSRPQEEHEPILDYLHRVKSLLDAGEVNLFVVLGSRFIRHTRSDTTANPDVLASIIRGIRDETLRRHLESRFRSEVDNKGQFAQLDLLITLANEIVLDELEASHVHQRGGNSTDLGSYTGLTGSSASSQVKRKRGRPVGSHNKPSSARQSGDSLGGRGEIDERAEQELELISGSQSETEFSSGDSSSSSDDYKPKASKKRARTENVEHLMDAQRNKVENTRVPRGRVPKLDRRTTAGKNQQEQLKKKQNNNKKKLKDKKRHGKKKVESSDEEIDVGAGAVQAHAPRSSSNYNTHNSSNYQAKAVKGPKCSHCNGAHLVENCFLKHGRDTVHKRWELERLSKGLGNHPTSTSASSSPATSSVQSATASVNELSVPLSTFVQALSLASTNSPSPHTYAVAPAVSQPAPSRPAMPSGDVLSEWTKRVLASQLPPSSGSQGHRVSMNAIIAKVMDSSSNSAIGFVGGLLPVAVNIGSIATSAILDTGAQVNLISHDCFEQIRAQHGDQVIKLIEPSPRFNLVGVGNASLPAERGIYLRLSLSVAPDHEDDASAVSQLTTTWVPFVVANRLIEKVGVHDIILGLPFYDSHVEKLVGRAIHLHNGDATAGVTRGRLADVNSTPSVPSPVSAGIKRPRDAIAEVGSEPAMPTDSSSSDVVIEVAVPSVIDSPTMATTITSTSDGSSSSSTTSHITSTVSNPTTYSTIDAAPETSSSATKRSKINESTTPLPVQDITVMEGMPTVASGSSTSTPTQSVLATIPLTKKSCLVSSSPIAFLPVGAAAKVKKPRVVKKELSTKGVSSPSWTKYGVHLLYKWNKDDLSWDIKLSKMCVIPPRADITIHLPPLSKGLIPKNIELLQWFVELNDSFWADTLKRSSDLIPTVRVNGLDAVLIISNHSSKAYTLDKGSSLCTISLGTSAGIEESPELFKELEAVTLVMKSTPYTDFVTQEKVTATVQSAAAVAQAHAIQLMNDSDDLDDSAELTESKQVLLDSNNDTVMTDSSSSSSTTTTTTTTTTTATTTPGSTIKPLRVRGLEALPEDLRAPLSTKEQEELLQALREEDKQYKAFFDKTSALDDGLDKDASTSFPDKEEHAQAVTALHEALSYHRDRAALKDILPILRRYLAVFHPPKHLQTTNLTECYIRVADDQAPIKQPRRRHPLVQQEEIQQEVDSLVGKGVIEPSNSPWAANLVVVNKKDGTKRYCVDYRDLNKVTIKDSYPLPRIDDLLDTVGRSKAKYFSSLDLRSGYWQVGMAPGSKEKTAFYSPKGLYQFKVMPFGLVSAPAIFQRTMHEALGDLIGKCCIDYIDDILVCSNTLEQHALDLAAVMSRLQTAGLVLKLEKCRFFQTEVHFLGHVVSGIGVAPDQSKIRAIQRFPAPVNVKSLQSFLGLANYYRKFVEGYSSICAPLFELLRGKGGNKKRSTSTKVASEPVSWKWESRHQQAFDLIKSKLQQAPVLTHFSPTDAVEFADLRLETDASLIAAGAVFSQRKIGVYHPVAFFSKTFTPTESRYSATEREGYAVYLAIKEFRHYLYGKKFTVVTDCKALPSIFTNGTVMNTRLSNWSQQVTEYTFQIIYQPGSQNLVADALSRRGEEVLADSISSVNASPLTHSVSSTYLHPRPSVISSASLPTDPSAISAAVQFLQHLSLTDLDEVWPAHAQGKLDPGKIGILNVSYRDLEQDKKLDLGSPNLAPYVPAYVNAGEKVEISVDSYAQTLFFGFVAQIQLYRRVTAPDWNVLHSPVGILKTETMDPPDYIQLQKNAWDFAMSSYGIRRREKVYAEARLWLNGPMSRDPYEANFFSDHSLTEARKYHRELSGRRLDKLPPGVVASSVLPFYHQDYNPSTTEWSVAPVWTVYHPQARIQSILVKDAPATYSDRERASVVYSIMHGTKMSDADMSVVVCPTVTQAFNAGTPVLDNFASEQLVDRELATYVEYLKAPNAQERQQLLERMQLDRYPRTLKKFLTTVESMYLEPSTGILMHTTRSSQVRVRDALTQVVIPTHLQNRLLHLYHSGIGKTHPGVKRMYLSLMLRFWWPLMLQDISKFVSQCPVCKVAKPATPQGKNRIPFPIQSMPTPKAPGDIISYDFITNMQPGASTSATQTYVSEYTSLLVIVDHFSRWVDAIPLKTREAKGVAEALLQWCSKFGFPRLLISDREKSFASEVHKLLLQLVGITARFTSAYHPEANGTTESFNGTFLPMFKAHIIEMVMMYGHHMPWEQTLPGILLGYRTIIHTAMKDTPSFMFLGRDIRLPIDLLIEDALPGFSGQRDELTYAREMSQRLRECYLAVRDAQLARAQEYERRYRKLNTKDLPPRKFEIDELVYLRLGSHTVDPRVSKYSPLAQGPYRVVSRFNNDATYELQLVADPNPANNRRAHIGRLIPYSADIQRYLNWLNSTDFRKRRNIALGEKKTDYFPAPLTDLEIANLYKLREAQAAWDADPQNKLRILPLAVASIPAVREMTSVWSKFHEDINTQLQKLAPIPTPEEVVEMTHEQLATLPRGPITRQRLKLSHDPKHVPKSMAEYQQ